MGITFDNLLLEEGLTDNIINKESGARFEPRQRRERPSLKMDTGKPN